MDLLTLLKLMMDEGDITRIARNPFSQFGSSMMRKTYLGARFFPERMMTESLNNIIEEEEVMFRTIIAEDSGRYDPAARRSSIESKSMQVAMGHFDAARDINGKMYDTIIKMLARSQDQSARRRMLSLVDTLLKYALLDKKEKQRWEMILDSEVTVEKANKQKYTVSVDAPTENRVVSAGFFDDNSFNPFTEIFKGVDVLKAHGFNRIQAFVSTYKPISAMRSNEIVQRRTGGLQVDTVNNSITPITGVVTDAQINQILSQQGIPPITEYNEGYNTEAGFFPYIPRDAMVLIASTPRREEIIVPDGEDLLLHDTLGYYGVGLCQGETEVGDVIKLFPKENKPVRIEGEAQGVGFPVPLETKAIYVMRGCVAA